jgi:hypothetical protein
MASTTALRTIPTSFLSNLQGAALSQLETAVNIAAERALAAAPGRARSIWVGKRAAVEAEIERRGYVAFKLDAQATDWLVVRYEEYADIRRAQWS